MTSDSIPQELQQIRARIDEIDRELLELLARRFQLTHDVGVLKATRALEALDADREAQKLADLRALCEEHQLNPALVTELFSRIMQEVVSNHKQLRDRVDTA